MLASRCRALNTSCQTRQTLCSLTAKALPQCLINLRNKTNQIRSISASSNLSEVQLTNRKPTAITTSSSNLKPQKIREEWRTQAKSQLILRDTQPHVSRLEFLFNSFKKSLISLSSKLQNDHTLCIITAWLVSDNTIVDLFNRIVHEHPEFSNFIPRLIAVDTLHLFPETLQTARLMRDRYPNIMKSLQWAKPDKCDTREEFNQLYGCFNDMTESEFDYWTKVEPLQRIIKQYQYDHKHLIVVTGRRNDQGSQRTSMPLWEEEKMTFNPLVNWTWNDVVFYSQHYNIPINPLHSRIYIDPFNKFIGKKDRDTYQNFLELTLDFPYFFYHEEVLRKAFSHKDSKHNFYVWKSFGDTITSVPVSIDESEREGRFVHRHGSECGIHTRVSNTKKAPHGGSALVNLVMDDKMVKSGVTLKPGIDYDRIMELNERQVCDLELLMNGGYTPLNGFMNRLEYDSCVHEMRLTEGSLWGLPIVLDSNDSSIKEGDRLLLRSLLLGGDLAIMTVENIWKPDKTTEALRVFNTTSCDHPYINYMRNEMGTFYIGGPINKGIQLPSRSWLSSQYRVATPTELRERYRDSSEVLAFQCRNPLHRAHVEMFSQNNDNVQVVVHPSIGPSKQDDFDARVRVPTYEILQKTLHENGIDVFYMPYHMRLGGPRETIQHLICRKNYGFTQMIVGRDHAGCKDSAGNDYYGPYDAQELAEKYSQELGIKPISFKQMVYVPKYGIYMSTTEAQSKSLETRSISGTEFRRRINSGLSIPEWYAFPEVVRLLEASFRYHLTDDPQLPESTAITIKQPVISLSVQLSSESPSVDPKLSDQIISISKHHTSIPFFVIPNTTSLKNAIQGPSPNVKIQIITAIDQHSSTPSIRTSIFNSFEELDSYLTSLPQEQ